MIGDMEWKRYVNEIGQRSREITHWSCENCDREKYGNWTGIVWMCKCGQLTLKEYKVVINL